MRERQCLVCRCRLDGPRGDEPRISAVWNGTEYEVTAPLCSIDLACYHMFESVRQAVRKEIAFWVLEKGTGRRG